MNKKNVLQRCILVVVTRGFDEAKTIHLISVLRESGLCVKILGNTSGLINGRYGIDLMPDMTFSDLADFTKTSSARMIILPESRQCLKHLENDPRLHHFLRDTLADGGQIVINADGNKFLKKISVGDPGLLQSNNYDEQLLLCRGQGQSINGLARDILSRMGQSSNL